MAVSDFALVTLNEIKLQLNLADVDVRRDKWLEVQIENVSRQFETHIGRGIVARSYLQHLDGTGASTLFVDQYPVLLIQTLWDDIDRDFQLSTNHISRTSRAISEDAHGVIRVWRDKGIFQQGRGNIRIQYFAGYANLDVAWGSTQFVFTEVSGGTRYLVTIPPNRYDVISLGSQAAFEMTNVGLNSYQVTFDPSLRSYTFTLATGSTGTLSILANTGTATFLPKMGFATTADLTGATAYTATSTVVPGIPEDLKQACIETVIHFYDRSGFSARERRDVKSEQIADYSITYSGNGGGGAGGLPVFATNVLDRYTSILID